MAVPAGQGQGLRLCGAHLTEDSPGMALDLRIIILDGISGGQGSAHSACSHPGVWPTLALGSYLMEAQKGN